MNENRTIILKFVALALLLALVVFHPGAACSQTANAGIDSGLARTPPMGWNSWNHFRLNINEKIIKAQAKAMVTSGMKAAGYEYIVIDGGWEGYHDAKGVFHPDILKFPHMKELCDYIHSLGLKVGIHTSPGPVTCSGREGSYGYEKQDAETFARWGIDFVKYDWCSGDLVYKPDQMEAAYRKMHDDLAATGRPMIFSLCQYGMQDVWKWGRAVGAQMWRVTGDISDNYFHMIANGFAENGLQKYAGPGHWNDPDMLEIGNGKMNDEECRTQMTLWCILAAPLFAGNDLTKMSPAVLKILTNREAIAVDQDPAGIQGHRVWQEGPIQVWEKPLENGAMALAVFNLNNHPMKVDLQFKKLGLKREVRMRDLWEHRNLGTMRGSYGVAVPPHGTVLLKVE